MTSESAEQNGTDKCERGAYRQHIQPQGYVHAWPPSLLNMEPVYQSLRLDRSP
jgi:hypothetical protein